MGNIKTKNILKPEDFFQKNIFVPESELKKCETKLADAEARNKQLVEALSYLAQCPEPLVVAVINGGEYVMLKRFCEEILVDCKAAKEINK